MVLTRTLWTVTKLSTTRLVAAKLDRGTRVLAQSYWQITDNITSLLRTTMAEPTAEEKARYETLKKELLQALPKKRQVDKQLVSAVNQS